VTYGCGRATCYLREGVFVHTHTHTQICYVTVAYILYYGLMHLHRISMYLSWIIALHTITHYSAAQCRCLCRELTTTNTTDWLGVFGPSNEKRERKRASAPLFSLLFRGMWKFSRGCSSAGFAARETLLSRFSSPGPSGYPHSSSGPPFWLHEGAAGSCFSLSLVLPPRCSMAALFTSSRHECFLLAALKAGGSVGFLPAQCASQHT